MCVCVCVQFWGKPTFMEYSRGRKTRHWDRLERRKIRKAGSMKAEGKALRKVKFSIASCTPENS